MSVQSAELEAAQDSLVASLGADEMRAMHLADPCLANQLAHRRSRRAAGVAASAASAAVLARQVPHGLWRETSNALSCVRRHQGQVVVVFLTCADAELATRLADLALTS